MARFAGGRVVAGGLDKLREELQDYFGALNEIRAGVNREVPRPPEAYVKLQQCERLGLPLMEGGLMDQPHIWLLEVGVIREVERVFDALTQREEES